MSNYFFTVPLNIRISKSTNLLENALDGYVDYAMEEISSEFFYILNNYYEQKGSSLDAAIREIFSQTLDHAEEFDAEAVEDIKNENQNS